MYLADTNVLVELSKNSPAGHRAGPLLSSEGFRTTVVNISELFKWLEDKGGETALEQVLLFARSIELQDISFEDAVFGGQLSARHGLYLADAIILAVAVNHNLTLITMDSDFDKVKVQGAKIKLIKK